MERSYIEVSADGRGAEAISAKQITDHVNWDRYLSLIQGRVAYAPIKFNGQDLVGILHDEILYTNINPAGP